MSKPIINQIKLLAKTNLFRIEQLDLTFSNGETRQFERLSPFKREAVMIVPLLDDQTFLLAKEYCAGIEQYALGFPKGLSDHGEPLIEAANRELREEIGYAAKKLNLLMSLSLAPAYMSHRLEVFIATDLYRDPLPGDEPEEIEVVPWKFDDIDALLKRPDFTEARSVAAVLRARDYLESMNKK